MSVIQTANAAHNAACLVAEAARQMAVVPGASAAVVKAADLAFHRACLASALTNKCGVEPFLVALKSLGVNS